MWGRVIKVVGLVMLALILASTVSPWCDLAPANLRTSKRIHVTLALPSVVHVTLAVGLTLPAKVFNPQSPQACDIVARDCARLC
jgi:hypothetical protein